MATVSRLIHYFELSMADKEPEEMMIHIPPIIDHTIELNRDNRIRRYQKTFSGFVAVEQLMNSPASEQYQGRLIKINVDELPELMDMRENISRDVEAGEQEGIKEVCHFILDYGYPRPILAIEYNHIGPKQNHWNDYFSYIGRMMNIDEGVTLTPIIRQDMASYSRRIGRLKRFTAVAHKDNIAQIRNVHNELATTLQAAQNFGESDKVELDLYFNLRLRGETNTIAQKVRSMIASLLQQPENKGLFQTLDLEAEDFDKENGITIFDLLTGKVKSRVNVEKRDRSRSVVPDSIYEKMQEELRVEFPR